MFPSLIRFALSLTAVLAVVQQPRSVAKDDVSFHRDVAPILRARCLRCHNDRDHRGGLSLQSRQSMIQGGESGAVIQPGDADASYLVDLLLPSDGTAEMPKRQTPLSPAEIGVIRRWIDAGADWSADVILEPPVLWSLQPIRAPKMPADFVAREEFPVRNPIDALVAAQHAQAGLSPAPPADPRTLVRRLFLDLTGLPPSPETVDAFVADPSEAAYEGQVQELLSSPHFGEQWGRHWLDLARYADSEGYLGDAERPHAWVYREWVIDAINRDLPFDEFTIAQLAGDLLDNPTLDQKIATGFHRNTLRNTEAGVDLELYRTKEIVDRVNTTGMVWLGLTLGCAECHDHKNDPIQQKEFYQLFAFFNNADEVGVTATRPWEVAKFEQALSVWQPSWEQLLQDLKRYEVAELTEQQKDQVAAAFAKFSKSSDLDVLADSYRTTEPGWAELRKQLEAALKARPARPVTKARAFTERTKDRRETFVHVRGVYNRPGEQVTAGTPAILPALPVRDHDVTQATSPVQPDRLDLARWLFHKDNPLTARVAVNRIWQHLFGHGLVTTPNDFGTQGAEPTHPLLLDWLATAYRRSGWSRKEMIRQIVMSSTYRLSSAVNAVPGQQQVGNRLLWRQNSYRVPAETVRDLHLAASGLLDRTIGRRGIRPPLPAFVTEIGRSVKWPVSEGRERYRRGMYIFFKRTVPYPMLMTFDAPDTTVSCSRRERSNTPLQALALLNDPVFHECAQALGQRAHREFPADSTAAIEFVFQRCLQRRPTAPELDYLAAAHRDLLRLGESEQQENAMASALVAIARIVMNLDEFVTRD